MLVFTASETLFMVSMAMSYFYSYQTYSIDNFTPGGEKSSADAVVGVELREVFATVENVLGTKLGGLIQKGINSFKNRRGSPPSNDERENEASPLKQACYTKAPQWDDEDENDNDTEIGGVSSKHEAS